MKSLRGLPTVQDFFETYAFLIKAIRRSGYAAQVISGLTEIGGIYAAAYTSILPIFPEFAIYAAGIIAVIGTALIEIGLRVLLPHSVDAALYQRFKGLYLPMTIAIWGCTFVLLGASGVISFSNSKTIVKEYLPAAEQLATAAQDSTWKIERAALQAVFSQDSAMIAERYKAQFQATEAAYSGKISAARQELANLRRKEARTGQSFASAKDAARQKIADLEAEQAAQLASMAAGKSSELARARRAYLDGKAAKENRYLAAVDSVGAINQAAVDERAANVSTYGGGLAWFTIIALFVLVVSIILDRIHRKGSGIKESVELSQYDVSPPWWVNLRHAVSERFNQAVQSRITAFADRTPPAPLPGKPSELYDPAQLANIQITLKVDQGDGDEEGIIYIQPKRRQIGFRSGETPTDSAESSRDLYSTRNPEGGTPKHEHEKSNFHCKNCGRKFMYSQLVGDYCTSCIGDAPPKINLTEHETPNLREYKQRLKFYKKRLGSHQQKAIKLEQKGKPIPKRTLTAIENNEQWVQHYTDLINQATGRK